MAALATKSAGKYCVEPISDDYNIDKNDYCSARVLICAPGNAAANEIAKQLHTAASKNPKTTHVIIIRLHSVKTEDKVVLIASQAKDDQAVDVLIPIVDYLDLAIVFLLYAAHAETRTRQHEVKNKRYILHKMSLATWMQLITRWIGFHPFANFKRHHIFKVLFEKTQNNVPLDKNNIIVYTIH